VVDKSWGTPSPSAGFRIRTNDSPEQRAAARAEARDARLCERGKASAQQLKDRAAARETNIREREAAREARRAREQDAATGDPHAAAAARRRGSGRKDVVREQRDTRAYTTLVDVDRVRALAKRGASVTGLAGAFGITEVEVEHILSEG
jgi:hypothetical protein